MEQIHSKKIQYSVLLDGFDKKYFKINDSLLLVLRTDGNHQKKLDFVIKKVTVSVIKLG